MGAGATPLACWRSASSTGRPKVAVVDAGRYDARVVRTAGARPRTWQRRAAGPAGMWRVGHRRRHAPHPRRVSRDPRAGIEAIAVASQYMTTIPSPPKACRPGRACGWGEAAGSTTLALLNDDWFVLWVARRRSDPPTVGQRRARAHRHAAPVAAQRIHERLRRRADGLPGRHLTTGASAAQSTAWSFTAAAEPHLGTIESTPSWSPRRVSPAKLPAASDARVGGS